jgi:hypothetical protein
MASVISRRTARLALRAAIAVRGTIVMPVLHQNPVITALIVKSLTKAGNLTENY